MSGTSTNDAQVSSSGKVSKQDFKRLHIYESIKETIVTTVDQFLRPFLMDPDSASGLRLMRLNEFFPSFYGQANRFADNFCQTMVKIIRSSSIVESVQQTPTPALAKRVRDVSFKVLDRVLSQYASAAKKIHVIGGNLDTIRHEMEKAKTMAAIGEPVSNKANSTSENIEWATEGRFEEESNRLLQAKIIAFAQIIEYIKALQTLPEASVIYACEKCFGPEVSFDLRGDQIEEATKFIEPRVAMAVEAFERVSMLEKDDLQLATTKLRTEFEQDRILSALEHALEHKSEADSKADKKFKKTMMLFVVFCVCVVIIVFVYFGIQAGLIQIGPKAEPTL